MDLTLFEVQTFMLIFFRMTGLFLTAPLFGSGQIPPLVKIWLSFIMAILVFPLAGAGPVPAAPNLGIYAVAAAAELAVGLLLGLAAQMLFVAVQMGGMIIGQELGLTMANVIDPITNDQVSVVSQFKLLLAVLIYLAIDGHHVLIGALMRSFGALPVASLTLRDPALELLSDGMVGEMLRVSVQVAAPVLVSLFLVTVALGFMARTVPEMNIFSLGFGLRILLGFVVAALAVPVFRWLFLSTYQQNTADVTELLRLLSP
jgi:flagellar biosynthetic protein FliR